MVPLMLHLHVVLQILECRLMHCTLQCVSGILLQMLPMAELHHPVIIMLGDLKHVMGKRSL